MIATKVYVSTGSIGIELRASEDINPGDILFREASYAFACEDENDGDSLPAIVQVAMNALEKGSNDASGRTFEQLSSIAEDGHSVQNESLFEWGAEQILSRLTNQVFLRTTSKANIIEAIRRVALNSFTVKRLLETEIDLLDDDLDLVQCVMHIGSEYSRGVGLYLLGSAANHSCAPNTFVTFDDDNKITFRATKSIRKHKSVTISYGPVVGVDGGMHDRRKDILESHRFHCRCSMCESEATAPMAMYTSSADDFEAMEFIDNVIVGGNFTATEALEKSENVPANIMKTSMFGKAMTDTSLQTVALDLEIAIGFQNLALQSLELRCPKDHLVVAFDILRVCLLRIWDGEKTDRNHIERARDILRRHYGADYAFKQTLNAFYRTSS
jgi:hypothetical protein